MAKLNDELFNRVFDPQHRGDLVALEGEFGSPIATAARLAISQGQPEPLNIYADDRAVVRRLSRSPEHDAKLRALDSALIAVIALGLKNQSEFSVGIKREDAGPIAIINQAPGRIEVTLSSNFDLVEPKDSLFAAQLSLLEWTGIRTDFLGKYIFRKVWHKDSDPIAVAAAIALPLVYIFNSLRDGGAVIYHTVEDSAVLAHAQESFAMVKTDEYTYIRAFISDYFDELDAVEASDTTPQHETKLALINISTAEQVAAENEDEVGMQALSQMRDDLNFRASYVDEAMMDVRELVSAEPVSDLTERFDRLFEEALDEATGMAFINRESFLMLDRGKLRDGHPDDQLSKISKDSPCLTAGILVQYDRAAGYYNLYYREGLIDLDENFESRYAISGMGSYLVHIAFDHDQFNVQVGTEFMKIVMQRNITEVEGQPLKEYNTDLHFYPLPPTTSDMMDLVWRDRIMRLTDELTVQLEDTEAPEPPTKTKPQAEPTALDSDWRVAIVPESKTHIILHEMFFGNEQPMPVLEDRTDDELLAVLLGWHMRQMPYEVKAMMPFIWREFEERCVLPEMRSHGWHEREQARAAVRGTEPTGRSFLTPSGISSHALEEIEQRIQELDVFLKDMEHEWLGDVEEYNDEVMLRVAHYSDQVLLDAAAYRFRNGLRGPKPEDAYPEEVAAEIARRGALRSRS